MSSDAVLRAALEDNAAHVLELERAHDDMVQAARDSNADDEHDPEGATLAFEREQVAALLAAARRRREELRHALEQVREGTYGVCERCAGPIGAGRLEARPTARTCIRCATGAR